MIGLFFMSNKGSHFLRRLVWLSTAISCCFLLSQCATHREKSNKEKAYLHTNIGNKYLVAGQSPAALKEFLAAEKLDPDNAKLQNNLALAYYVRKSYVLAEKHVRRALQLDPNFTEARNNLGKILTNMGLFDEAIQVLKIATEDLTFKQPDTTWSNLGMAYFAKGDFKNANSALQRSLEISSEHCTTYTYYGRSFLELKDYTKASQALDQALQLCSGAIKTEAKFFGALSYIRAQKKDQGIARLQEIIEESPNLDYAERAKKLLNIIKQ